MAADHVHTFSTGLFRYRQDPDKVPRLSKIKCKTHFLKEILKKLAEYRVHSLSLLILICLLTHFETVDFSFNEITGLKYLCLSFIQTVGLPFVRD